MQRLLDVGDQASFNFSSTLISGNRKAEPAEKRLEITRKKLIVRMRLMYDVDT